MTGNSWDDDTIRRRQAERANQLRRKVWWTSAIGISVLVVFATVATFEIIFHKGDPPVTASSGAGRVPLAPSTVPLGSQVAGSGLPPPATDGCSAASWTPPGNTPQEVDGFASLGTPEATAAYVAAKGVACDYDGLRVVMADDFAWSSDEAPGADAAIASWRAGEASRQAVLYDLVLILGLGNGQVDPGTGTTTWKDPSAHTDYQVVIDANGQWLSFAPSK
jgi:hypothetical protein